MVASPLHPAGSSRRYRPAWWLPGRHLRTLWGRLGRRMPAVETRRERWDTADGDVLELDRLDGAFGADRVLGGVAYVGASLHPDGSILSWRSIAPLRPSWRWLRRPKKLP